MGSWPLVLACWLTSTLPPIPAASQVAGAALRAEAGPAPRLHAKRKAPPRRPPGKAKKARAARGAPPTPTAVPGAEPAVAGPAQAPATPATPAALPPPRPLPLGYKAVAVLPLAGIDVSLEMVHEIEVALLNEIDETQGLRAVTPGDVVADNIAIDLDPEMCDLDIGCLARAGRHAGAHLALETRVVALGGTVSLSLRLVDTERAVEVGRVAEALSDDVAQRATELHRLAVQLLTPEIYVGTLRIRCSQDGAEVFLDDKQVGTTPIVEPLKGLRAGPHILRLSKPGFSDLYQFVDVVYNRSATVEVDLSTTTVVGVMVEAESQTGLGALYVATAEPGVEIRSDGEPKGVTPLAGPISGIPAGRRRISLRKEGFEPFVQEVEIVAGKRTDLTVTLSGTRIVEAALVVVNASASLPGLDLSPETAARAAAARAGGYEPTWRLYAGVAGAGLGVAGIAAGAFYGARVSRLNAQARDQVEGLEPAGGGRYSCTDLSRESCAERVAELSRLRRDARTAQRFELIGLMGGAALLLAGGGLSTYDYVSQQGWPSWVPLLGASARVVPQRGGALVTVGVGF